MTSGHTFVSEKLDPVGSFSSAPMSIGEPGLPERFKWRDRQFEITAVLNSWREMGNCTHGSAERYVTKHWFRVASHGTELTLYFERRARGDRRIRWFLYCLKEPS